MSNATLTDTRTPPSLQERDQIMTLEEKEEARLQKALTEIADADQSAEREWAEKIQAAEAKAKAEANEQLKQYKETELSRILEEGESRAQSEASETAKRARKNMPAVVDSLLKEITTLSF